MSALETLVDSLGEIQQCQPKDRPQPAEVSTNLHPLEEVLKDNPSVSCTVIKRDLNLSKKQEQGDTGIFVTHSTGANKTREETKCRSAGLSVTVINTASNFPDGCDSDLADGFHAEVPVTDPSAILKCELVEEHTSEKDDCVTGDSLIKWVNELPEMHKTEVAYTTDEESEYRLEPTCSANKNMPTFSHPKKLEQKWSTNLTALPYTMGSSEKFKYDSISDQQKHSDNKKQQILCDRNYAKYSATCDVEEVDRAAFYRSTSADGSNSNDEVSIINDIASELDSSLLLIPEISTQFSGSMPPSDTFHSLPCLQNLVGGNMGPSPSRQSCLCPLCGRHIAQRRSLKQHLMSNFHKLTAAEADHMARRSLSSRHR